MTKTNRTLTLLLVLWFVLAFITFYDLYRKDNYYITGFVSWCGGIVTTLIFLKFAEIVANRRR